MGRFPMEIGDKFVDRDSQGILEYQALDVFTQTITFVLNGFHLVMDANEFFTAYVHGQLKEVPGAGNVREVVS